MATDPRHAAYQALYAKRVALAKYIQLLFTRNSEDPDMAMLERGRAQIELDLVFALIQELDSNLPVQMPDENEVARLRAATARLAHLVALNGALNELIEAADEVISTWPS